MANFWSSLSRPIFALAPMANVTDAAFRRIITKYGKPPVVWTEFVSVEGLLSVGREKLLVDFWHTPQEHPIVAQIFGGKPEQFYEVAKLCVELGFDGIDINMGCPHDGIVKSCAGADLITDPGRAQKIISETKRGAGILPVSVKTRIGYNKIELDTWLPAILESEPAAVTLHLRTRKEMSAVPAHWELARQAVQIRDNAGSKSIILGNGDVNTLEEARARVAETGCDGVMIGRGIFGNPWLFIEQLPSVQEKLRVCVEHTKLFEELFGEGKAKDGGRIKNFDVMKKHYKAYVNGFDGAKELRMKMMAAKTAGEIERIVEDFLSVNI